MGQVLGTTSLHCRPGHQDRIILHKLFESLIRILQRFQVALTVSINSIAFGDQLTSIDPSDRQA